MHQQAYRLRGFLKRTNSIDELLDLPILHAVPGSRSGSKKLTRGASSAKQRLVSHEFGSSTGCVVKTVGFENLFSTRYRFAVLQAPLRHFGLKRKDGSLPAGVEVERLANELRFREAGPVV